MQIANAFRILGLLLMVFSFTLLPPIAVGWVYQEHTTSVYAQSFLATFLVGFLCWLPLRRQKKELRSRDGFFIVVLFWSVLCFFGALPFYLTPMAQIRFIDAWFESISGLTTTGATVLPHIEALPNALRYYRQQLQFFGGMGIIVLAVAILPMLGIGGSQMYRAEVTGPIKDNKLTPRITQTAKFLWLLYCSMTAVCCMLFWAAGMSFFDALNYSFGTVSTGGFAPFDHSMAHYNNLTMEGIAMVFMLLSATNFALHFAAIRHADLKVYFQDTEFKVYAALACLIAFATIMALNRNDFHQETAWRAGLFQTVSFLTTTGLTSSNVDTWPSFLPMLMLYLGLVGGCAGSTSGGIKMMRLILVLKLARREIKNLIHPKGIFTIRLNRAVVPEHVTNAVWSFMGIYSIIFSLILLLLMACGLDVRTAISAAIGCFANLGPGLGDVASHYGQLPDTAKCLLSAAMLVGRLEVFTVLVIISPVFWRS